VIPEWLFDPEGLTISSRLCVALLLGGLVGLERSYHGRPAGFRTHALVCLSTSLLMMVTVYEDKWFVSSEDLHAALDPTRMAQGIMTGIGFLGAGVIVQEGVSVRGLTTAASIWITAAIGVLIGIGFYFPALFAFVLTLGTLSVFRWIENKLPVVFYARFIVRFARDATLPEAEMRALVAQHGFTIANLNYRLDVQDDFFEYRMVVRSHHAGSAQALIATLKAVPTIREFRLSPTGD
jgi:putative Mg2+ transporter-C (MgtC) family protein